MAEEHRHRGGRGSREGMMITRKATYHPFISLVREMFYLLPKLSTPFYRGWKVEVRFYASNKTKKPSFCVEVSISDPTLGWRECRIYVKQREDGLYARTSRKFKERRWIKTLHFDSVYDFATWLIATWQDNSESPQFHAWNWGVEAPRIKGRIYAI